MESPHQESDRAPRGLEDPTQWEFLPPPPWVDGNHEPGPAPDTRPTTGRHRGQRGTPRRHYAIGAVVLAVIGSACLLYALAQVFTSRGAQPSPPEVVKEQKTATPLPTAAVPDAAPVADRSTATPSPQVRVSAPKNNTVDLVFTGFTDLPHRLVIQVTPKEGSPKMLLTTIEATEQPPVSRTMYGVPAGRAAWFVSGDGFKASGTVAVRGEN